MSAKTPSSWAGAYVAVSHLDELAIGTAKELFYRFRRYGVYEWKDVFNLAGHSLDKQIMAFIFSHTECFSRPVSLAEARKIGIECGIKNIVLQSPFQVNSRFYERISTIGVH